MLAVLEWAGLKPARLSKGAIGGSLKMGAKIGFSKPVGAVSLQPA